MSCLSFAHLRRATGCAVMLLGLVSAQAAQAVAPFADGSRLLAIGGSLTEIVFALGEQSRLVGRDTTAIYPPEAFALPDVGYMRQLAPEGVLSARPSALLVIEGSGPPHALEVISASGVPVLTVPEDYSGASILTKIEMVGAALGTPDKAAELIADLDAELAATRAVSAQVETRKRVLFILSVVDGKLNASGTGTAADGAIRLAGADNVVTDYSGYKLISAEALLGLAPDAILVMSRDPATDVRIEDLLANPAIAATPAGKTGAIYRVDAGALLGFGPRTPAAARQLAETLYAPQPESAR